MLIFSNSEKWCEVDHDQKGAISKTGKRMTSKNTFDGSPAGSNKYTTDTKAMVLMLYLRIFTASE